MPHPEATQPSRRTVHQRITKGVPESTADTMGVGIVPRKYHDYPDGSLDQTVPSIITTKGNRIEYYAQQKKQVKDTIGLQTLSSLIRRLAQSIPPRIK